MRSAVPRADRAATVTARPAVVAVVGPTATGKTRLAVALAERLDGELVNGDSRQAIAELRVGVAKPEGLELRGIPCHGLDWRHLGEPFTAHDFVIRAEAALQGVAERGRVPILVGGTGLYLRALLRGYDFGGVPPREDRGAAADGPPVEALAAELERLAPARAIRTDLRNSRRVVRALELARAGADAGRLRHPWPAVWLGRALSAAALRQRIERRSEWLVGPALLAEVATLLASGVAPGVRADVAIGYREAIDWRDGRCGREEAVARVAQRTWRYARRQRTWFRSEPQVQWVGDDGADEAAIADEASRVVARGPVAVPQEG